MNTENLIICNKVILEITTLILTYDEATGRENKFDLNVYTNGWLEVEVGDVEFFKFLQDNVSSSTKKGASFALGKKSINIRFDEI